MALLQVRSNANITQNFFLLWVVLSSTISLFTVKQHGCFSGALVGFAVTVKIATYGYKVRAVIVDL